MPLMTTRASGSVRAFGLTILSALTSILETFNRSNQSGLGSSRGQRWRILRGAWNIVSNRASSPSAGSENALATLRFTKTDVTVSISGADPGMGASFWVTDGNNWYASVYTQTEVCQTCSNCNSFSGGNCNAFNPSNCAQNAVGNCSQGTFCCGNFNAPSCCGVFNPVTCAPGATNPVVPGNCNVFNSANTGNRNPPFGFCFGPSRNPSTGGNCNSFTGGNCACPQPGFCNANCCPGPFNTWSPYCVSFNPSFCAAANPVVCNAFFTFSCNCTTEHRISILRSLANTVTTVSNNLFSAAIQSFRTILSGNQATIQAFSTSSYTSQIGNSIVVPISSPQKTTQHGIIKSTSSFQQGSSIDEFGVS